MLDGDDEALRIGERTGQRMAMLEAVFAEEDNIQASPFMGYTTVSSDYQLFIDLCFCSAFSGYWLRQPQRFFAHIDIRLARDDQTTTDAFFRAIVRRPHRSQLQEAGTYHADEFGNTL